MKVLILGGDGYLGWPTAMHFSRLGHEVAVVDNMAKRLWEAECGVEPLVPIPPLMTRIRKWKRVSGKTIQPYIGDIAESARFIYGVCEELNPEVIVHYAEQPSAPYSMADRSTCVYTQRNNILGTLNLMFAMQAACPDAHLVKLGTMGEYGTPNIDIEEGWIDIVHKGRSARMLYPKSPGSFYHLTKVHDSHNLEFGCRIWDMRVTDLNQGIVYGYSTDEIDLDHELRTSFHYDSIFGTVLNRFVVEAALGYPLTVYGSGGQTRTFLNIRDTLQCVYLAATNPAEPGEFRVMNQYTEQFSVKEMADLVVKAGASLGINVQVENIDNPRVEKETHYYKPVLDTFVKLGLKPRLLTEQVVTSMIQYALAHKEHVDSTTIAPAIKWRQRLSVLNRPVAKSAGV